MSLETLSKEKLQEVKKALERQKAKEKELIPDCEPTVTERLEKVKELLKEG